MRLVGNCGLMWTARLRGRSSPGEPNPNGGTTHRGHVQCAQLNSHTTGLQSYERVSISLAVSNIGRQVCALWLVSDGRDGEYERAYR
jgi:hypothetical protein